MELFNIGGDFRVLMELDGIMVVNTIVEDLH